MYIYHRLQGNSQFSRFGEKLTAISNANERSNQGYSIALSRNHGTTLAMGGPDYSNGAGSVWIFQRDDDGSTGRFRQRSTQRIPSPISDAINFGFSLAMSDDASILLVGAPFHFPRGAVFAYRLDANSKQYDRILHPQRAVLPSFACSTNCMFGFSLAISSSGNRFVAGAPFHRFGDTQVGAAYIFKFSNPAQRDDTITNTTTLASMLSSRFVNTQVISAESAPGDEPITRTQGFSVAMSGDGHSILVGGNQEGMNGEGAIRFYESKNIPR